MFCVYVLKSSKDNKLYIGLTSNLKRRITEHNSGQTRSTKGRRPFTLVYCEAYLDFQDAEAREQKLKRFKNFYAELKKRISHSLSKA